MPKYKIVNLETKEEKLLENMQSPEDAIYWAFGLRVYFVKVQDSIGYYRSDGVMKYSVREIPEITLDYEDLVKISEYLCKNDEVISKQVGPTFLEVLLLRAVREIKNVDFFKEGSIGSES